MEQSPIRVDGKQMVRNYHMRFGWVYAIHSGSSTFTHRKRSLVGVFEIWWYVFATCLAVGFLILKRAAVRSHVFL